MRNDRGLANGWGLPNLLRGEIVEINQAVVDQPDTANSDPYEAGWLVILKLDDWDDVKGQLVVGTDVAAPYEAKMQADGFDGCG